MLLRRITEHIKAQNWTAVALDFVIVVVGVFIGIQVANWNEARQSSARLNEVRAQLLDEFTEIKTLLERQIRFRTRYVENVGALIAAIENPDEMISEDRVKAALEDAMSVGRHPSQSAAYLQLTASGDLALLGDDALETALIRYHSRLERDDFLQPMLANAYTDEVLYNDAVDLDILNYADIGAAVDDVEETYRPGDLIRSYDFEGIKRREKHYENVYNLHSLVRDAERQQLVLANEVLTLLNAGDR